MEEESITEEQAINDSQDEGVTARTSADDFDMSDYFSDDDTPGLQAERQEQRSG